MGFTRNIVFVFAVALASLGLSAGARAQPEQFTQTPSDADLAEARSLYLVGHAAAEARRWADARRQFEQSYRLSGAPPALFNHAFALRALGQYRASEISFTALLDRHQDALDEVMRRRAEELRAQVRARIAEISLSALDAGEVAISVDGMERVDSRQRPLIVRVDPGEHALELRRPGAHFSWRGSLDDGEELEVPIRWEREVVPQAVVVPRVQEAVDGGSTDTEMPIWEEPWLWVVVGALVLGGVGLVVGLEVSGPGQLEPLSERVVRL